MWPCTDEANKPNCSLIPGPKNQPQVLIMLESHQVTKIQARRDPVSEYFHREKTAHAEELSAFRPVHHRQSHYY